MINPSFAEETPSLCFDGKQVIFNYTVTNNTIAIMCTDFDAQSVILTVNPESSGFLTIDIPKKAINAFSSCDDKVEPFVLANGEEISYAELKNTEKILKIGIEIPSNTEEIEIIGNYLSMFPESHPDCSHLYEDHRINITPLQQTKLGILPEDVICESDLELIIRPNLTPACVKYDSLDMLYDKGWHNVSEIKDPNFTKWQLDGNTIPITLDNMSLNYIRAEYNNQKILMYVTITDDKNPGNITFAFPNQIVSQIFDKESCSISGDTIDKSNFNLRVNQEFRGIIDVSRSDKIDPSEDILLSLQVPEDSTHVELFSTCSFVVPFLDKILTVSENNDFVRYAIDENAIIVDVSVDDEYPLFLVTMNSTSAGNLIIELPRSVVDSKNDSCPPRLEFPNDHPFIILANNIEIVHEEIFTTPERRILMIPFDENTSEIEIVGHCLI